MKAILRIALVLLIMVAGLAWANQGEVEEQLPAPPVEQPQQLEPEGETQDEEVDIEKLLKADSDKVDVDACCCAECFEAFEACTAGCGGSWPCFQACRADLNECRSNC